MGTSAAPIGSFDTPADLATGVTGSVAVTGWALDDVDVTAVRILRSTIPGICHAPVPIGTATMVDGARPDIASAFSTYPRNTRGGLGLHAADQLPAGPRQRHVHAVRDR
jgi:hypothetical protein